MKPTPQSIFDAEFRRCPRSPQFKEGALAGLQKAALQPYTKCPYESGDAREDAWIRGFDYGYAQWRESLVDFRAAASERA